MRVVALISGGKDSCFNMLQCVKHGHEIVALANLRPPPSKDELDSYMYQTVGHNAIELYSEAMGVPLFRRTIKGLPLEQDMNYIINKNDEVEDLYELLKDVMAEIHIEGVSSGAIFSDYQKVRVENVCSRLGLTSFAYLWHRNQEDLLKDMIDSDINSIIIKVAAMGLDPKKHLGKSIAEMYSYLLEINKKYGCNICGEGGEYETFTLNCPMFKKRIVIDSQQIVIHSDDAFAPVGYLCFNEMHLEEKIK
ncbi:diphthine--ammonia ligase-like [Xenia sp. Carnegie-2017]|uniref:diphthine--ammonia ligase-like n=1 Tax=Xenia sp. Carnegie-2017 TaxID=2897299 RepID=UPI001F049302|nr:diphthine--ammonia ligase-like [Xenia sp. Carnegie-2017]